MSEERREIPLDEFCWAGEVLGRGGALDGWIGPVLFFLQAIMARSREIPRPARRKAEARGRTRKSASMGWDRGMDREARCHFYFGSSPATSGSRGREKRSADPTSPS